MADNRRPVTKLKETVTTSTVHGKYCLWFAWAPEGVPGPEGETVDADYLPLEVDVAGIQAVRVTAVPTDEWWHHPGNKSNAGGLSTTRDLQNDDYRSDTYRSKKIDTLKAKLNLLVGMLGPDPDTPPTSPVSQIEIGLGEDITIDNIADTRLYLGFHDGHEWSNNGGSVNVSIEILKKRD